MSGEAPAEAAPVEEGAAAAENANPLLAELRTLKLTQLRKRALADGLDEAAVEEAADSDEPKEALIELIVAEAARAAQGQAAAATKLQSAQRQKTARRRVEGKREERREQNAAATKVQSAQRQKTARRRVEGKREERREQKTARRRVEGKREER